VAFVPQAQYEIVKTVMGIDLHNVPEDGFATDLNKGLGTVLCFLPEAGSHATTENHNFNFHVVLTGLLPAGFRTVAIVLLILEALLAGSVRIGSDLEPLAAAGRNFPAL
jgi:hypothetical protein